MTHESNTPRTHNAKGQKVNEPAQCIVCLQAWPCENERQRLQVERLETLLRERDKTISDLRDQEAELRHEIFVLRATAVVNEPPHIYGEETL